VVESLRPAIADSRVFARFRRLLLSQLTTEERRTITHLMETSGRMDHDWSGDYRVFSRDAWESTEVFGRLLPSIISLHAGPPKLVVASLDDTNVRRRGRASSVSYRRVDVAPFQATGSGWFVQTASPFFRTFTVEFPSRSTTLPHAKASQGRFRRGLAAHRQRARSRHLAVYGRQAIERLRNDLNGTSARPTLLVMVGSSYQ
jgi:hypothetical protein